MGKLRIETKDGVKEVDFPLIEEKKNAPSRKKRQTSRKTPEGDESKSEG